jgi:DNA-binding transcriptional LysR family regulator
VAVCSRDHPVAMLPNMTVSSLVKHRLLLLEPGTKNRMLLDEAFIKHGVKPASIMEFGSVEVQKSFAEAGIGIAVVPEFAVSKKDRKGGLKSIPIRKIRKNEIGIIVKKNRKLSPAASEFIAFLDSENKKNNGAEKSIC